jgi:rhodanese-related sulfurtransferase
VHASESRICTLIVYCYGPGCTRSRFCSTTAARHGWRNLWWYKDGADGWRSAGLALERAP